jgi:hypothetical protein
MPSISLLVLFGDCNTISLLVWLSLCLIGNRAPRGLMLETCAVDVHCTALHFISRGSAEAALEQQLPGVR